MAPKRLPLSFSEFEPKGRRAILRTVEEVEAEAGTSELNTEQVKSEKPKVQPKMTRENEPTNGRTKEQTHDRPNEVTNIRTIERTDQRTNEGTDERTGQPTIARAKVRHSFDVFKDQLLALNELQVEAFRASGHKPGISEIVQEALDRYLSGKERKSVRTNERSNNK